MLFEKNGPLVFEKHQVQAEGCAFRKWTFDFSFFGDCAD